MGWGSANEIFDPTAQAVIEKVESGGLAPSEGTEILSVLIAKLQEGDWDTEDESLEQFVDYPYVVDAFEENSVYVRIDLGDEGSVASFIHAQLKPLGLGRGNAFDQAVDSIAVGIVRAYEND